MINKLFFFSSILFLQFTSCKKDVPSKPNEGSIIFGDDGVYITNEGNFQFGNAAISYYSNGQTDAVEDLFAPANNRPLGDVCQSMYLFNGKAYIVVNNSGKIEVVNLTTFVSETIISGFSSPRYFLPVSNSKAYVSDLYAQAISIVNLSNNTITGTIPCSGWTEELILAYGKVFVANQLRDKLYVINTLNDVLIDSISIGYGANSIVEDKNGKLWVLCGGNQADINASLYCIDPITHEIEKSFAFNDNGETPWRLNVNGSNDTLYFLNNGVFRMAITETTLPVSAFIAQGNKNFYGIGINPHNGSIYIADAVDYVQRGKIYIYHSNGSPISSFLAGIIPSEFNFN